MKSKNGMRSAVKIPFEPLKRCARKDSIISFNYLSMERMKVIAPWNYQFTQEVYGVNTSEEPLTLNYEFKQYVIKPNEIFQTDGPLANAFKQQSEVYEFEIIKTVNGASTAGEKKNLHYRLEFFNTLAEAEEFVEKRTNVVEVKEVKKPEKIYTQDSLKKLGAEMLLNIIKKLGHVAPTDATREELRGFILSIQAE